jgi:hypothetical protein
VGTTSTAIPTPRFPATIAPLTAEHLAELAIEHASQPAEANLTIYLNEAAAGAARAENSLTIARGRFSDGLIEGDR